MRTPLDDAVAAYLEHRRRRGLARDTRRLEHIELARLVAFCRQRRIVNPIAVTPAAAEAYAVHLARDYRTRGPRAGRPLARGSVAGALHTMRRFFRFLMREGVLLFDPAATLDLPSRPRLLLDRALSLADFQALVAAIDTATPHGVRNRAILEVLFGCGLRSGELVALDVDDVDLPAGLVIVRRSKGRTTRIVPIAGQARRWLARYAERVRPELVTAASERALFLAIGGGRLGRSSINLIVRDAARRARLVCSIMPHALRHGFATALLRGGADIHVVQRLLGHAYIDTTQHYTPLNVDDLARVHRRTHPRAQRLR